MARTTADRPAPADSPAAAKAVLRRETLARLKAMSEVDRRDASARIQEALFRLPAFRNARGVHCFFNLPIEVRTAPIFQACAERGIPTYVPVQIPAENRLGVARWSPGDSLAPGPLNIPEPPPEGREWVRDWSAIDLVVVPGVAFDRRGGRLGHGKGYYDRFLAELSQAKERNRSPGGSSRGVEFVAAAFQAQLVPQVPMEDRDVPVHWVLTESGDFSGYPR